MPGYKARDRRRKRKRFKAKHHAQAGNSTVSSPEARNRPTAKQGPEYGPKPKKAHEHAASVSEGQETPSGLGEILPVFDSGGVREARMISRAVRKGWIKPGPNEEWPMDWTLADFEAALARQGGKLSIAQMAAFAVIRDLNSEKPTIRQTTVKAALAMKAQNLSIRQHDERLDHHERALEARVGSNLAGTETAGGDVGVIIVIPHNNRDPIPEGAVIEGSVLSMDDDEPIEGSTP